MKTSNKILATTFLTLLIIVISTLVYVRANTVMEKTITAEGEISKRHYDIQGLHTLKIRSGQITLHQGEPYVEIKCADNIHQYINTEVEDGALEISLQNGAYDDIGYLDITISTQDIENITLVGSSTLTAENIFKTDVINITAQHSTSLDLPIEANIINVNSSNGAEIKLSGKGAIVNATVRNSGNINASNLEANVVNADVSDGSKLVTSVKEKLVVDISNSGEILYKGDPEVVIKNQSDGGRITKL